MLDLTSDIQKAIEYIEEHLTDDMDISDISGIAFLAPIQINKKTGKIKDMDYRVVEKSQFTVVGYCRRFNSETSYTDIPKFWDEVFAKEDNTIEGMFGVCT